MTTEERNSDSDDEVALLVRLADASSSIADERVARVRTAVHDAWRDEYVARQEKARRRWLMVAVPLALAASVVIVLAIWGPNRTPASGPAPVPLLVAHIDQVTGQVAAQIAGSPVPFAAGGAVMSGATLSISAGTVAMTLTSGVHLRLDASSTVRMDSATDVALDSGAVYVDSADAHPEAGASPISIHTTSGIVRDIGTQFSVRLFGAGIRIQVRDGQVRITDERGVDVRAGAGEELFSDGAPGPKTRSPVFGRRPIAVTGSTWTWAERAAPTFSVEGKTLGAFLDWVSREGGWTVTFADSTLAAAARATVVEGRPDLLKGLTPAEALDVVLPTCGLSHRIDGQRVVIARETSAGAAK